MCKNAVTYAQYESCILLLVGPCLTAFSPSPLFCRGDISDHIRCVDVSIAGWIDDGVLELEGQKVLWNNSDSDFLFPSTRDHFGGLRHHFSHR